MAVARSSRAAAWRQACVVVDSENHGDETRLAPVRARAGAVRTPRALVVWGDAGNVHVGLRAAGFHVARSLDTRWPHVCAQRAQLCAGRVEMYDHGDALARDAPLSPGDADVVVGRPRVGLPWLRPAAAASFDTARLRRAVHEHNADAWCFLRVVARTQPAAFALIAPPQLAIVRHVRDARSDGDGDDDDNDNDDGDNSDTPMPRRPHVAVGVARRRPAASLALARRRARARSWCVLCALLVRRAAEIGYLVDSVRADRVAFVRTSGAPRRRASIVIIGRRCADAPLLRAALAPTLPTLDDGACALLGTLRADDGIGSADALDDGAACADDVALFACTLRRELEHDMASEPVR